MSLDTLGDRDVESGTACAAHLKLDVAGGGAAGEEGGIGTRERFSEYGAGGREISHRDLMSARRGGGLGDGIEDVGLGGRCGEGSELTIRIREDGDSRGEAVQVAVVAGEQTCVGG